VLTLFKAYAKQHHETDVSITTAGLTELIKTIPSDIFSTQRRNVVSGQAGAKGRDNETLGSRKALRERITLTCELPAISI